MTSTVFFKISHLAGCEFHFGFNVMCGVTGKVKVVAVLLYQEAHHEDVRGDSRTILGLSTV
jgi:hypothetical protein